MIDESLMRERIRDARMEKGWSQTQLADQIGVVRQTINSIEQGRQVPSLEVALKLGKVLRRTIDELFGLDRGVGEGVRVAPPTDTRTAKRVRTGENGSKPRAESAGE